MTSLNTKNICFLAAFLFLSIVPTLAEVVGSVADCQGFLYGDTPPHIPDVPPEVWEKNQDQNRYKIICQTYQQEDKDTDKNNDGKKFLTLYDTVNKIPVFSAYRYNGSVGGRPKTTWKIEPQLEDEQKDRNMRKSSSSTSTKQAVDDNYRNNNRDLDRGHLFPSSHAEDEKAKISTFTLTNIVPQVRTFNQERWNKMEQCIKCIMDYYIKTGMQCFVVVGARPSDEKPENKLKDAVNIPDMLWSAFYCSKEKSWIGGAHWDKNVDKSDKYLNMEPLENLKNNEMTNGIEAFPGINHAKFVSDDIKDLDKAKKECADCRFQ